MLTLRHPSNAPDPLLPASDASADWPPTLEAWCLDGTRGRELVDHRPVGECAVAAEIAHPGGTLTLGPFADLVIGMSLTGADHVLADFGSGALRTRCHAGSLFVLPAGATVSLTMSRRLRMRLLGVGATQVVALRAALDDGAPMPGFDAVASRLFELPTTAALVGRTWELAGRDAPAARGFVEAAVTTILLDLANVGIGSADRRPKGGLAPWQLRKVTEYILENLTADVGLEELAGLLDLSPFHFCRAFRISTGQPPHRWRLNKRIALAQDLLISTKLSIMDIATRVGYEDSTNFSSAFRRATGVTPSRFRAEGGR